MKLILSLLLVSITFIIKAQYCEIENRFSSEDYFDSNEIESILDTLYATALNVDGEMQELKMDIYYPSLNVDDLAKRPCIILFHGGGFYQGDKSMFSYECSEFAKRGFIAVTVEYRLGKETDTGLEAVKRSYRARQDGHAAFRFIVKNKDLIGLDTDWMFIGGISAGSLLSHDLIYGEQSEWNLLFSSVTNELGQSDTSGNSYTHNFEIQGLYNNCGSVTSLQVDSDEMLPTIAFHKEHDHLVPIDENAQTYTYGSRKMHQELELNNVCSQLTVDTVWYNPLTGGHCAYTDWQGTLTRVNKTSCFFKNVFCESCDGGYSEELTTASCSNLTSTQNNAVYSSIQIYPNPVENTVNIDYIDNLESISVFNSTGQIMDVESSNFQIQADKFNPGLYYILLKFDNGFKSVSFIKL